MIRDYFALPWKEIKQRKLRSWLTLLGVFIGIAAIISLISLGQGLQNAISGQLSALGNDKLFLTAKGSALTAGLSIDAVKITDKDLDVVRGVSVVKQAAGFIYSTSKIEFNDQAHYFFVYGFPSDPEDSALINSAQSYKILNGRELQKSDKYKVVLGYEHTNPDHFGKVAEVGDKILIHDKEFKVVGIWQKTGSPPDDHAVTIPLDTYKEIFNKKDELGMIIIQVKDGDQVSAAAEEVTKELRKFRNQKEGEEDFSIQTPEQLTASFSTILDIVQIVLIGIAAISLLVGGVNITNSMYTSILQRTKEIGVMKAIGAKNSHILSLFLVESGFYGLGGGIIGVILGVGFAKLVEFIMKIFMGTNFLVVEINWWLIVGTLIFSFLVGCISGIAPAWKASKLNPVDSLRYE